VAAESLPANSAVSTSTGNSVGSLQSTSHPDCFNSSSSPVRSSHQPSTSELTLDSLKIVLQNNPKTKAIDLNKSHLTIEERKRVIAVSTSKLVELHSLYPSTDNKLTLASHLSIITGLPASVFFDRVSHRGYIVKYLDNMRSKSPLCQRKYTWKRKSASASHQLDPSISEQSIVEPGTLNDSFVGCARGVVDCNICGGLSI
jgi:hypothetical protein